MGALFWMLVTVARADDLGLWRRAEALFHEENCPSAMKMYERILKRPESEYSDGARYRIWECLLQSLPQNAESYLLPDATIEQTYISPSGKSIVMYQIPEAYRRLIAAQDAISGRTFADSAGLPLDSGYRLLPAQILRNYGHLQEAEARFFQILKTYPHPTKVPHFDFVDFPVGWFSESDELYLWLWDTCEAEGNEEKLIQCATQICKIETGRETSNCAHAEALYWADELDNFRDAARQSEKGDYEAAASQYLYFLQKFPKSRNYKLALSNAANNLGRAGHAGAAIQLYEEYLQRYPDDDWSPMVSMLIAGNNIHLLNFQEALSGYEQVAEKFPSSSDAPDACYNAALLKGALGDHTGAAQGFEQYATRWPDREDAEDVFWQAGREWEQVSDGIDFYQRYLQRFPAQNPDHLVWAWYKIAKGYEKRGDRRQAEQAADRVQQVFLENRERLSQEIRRIAAEGPTAELIARVLKFKEITWFKDNKRNIELLTITKQMEIKAIDEAAVALTTTYLDFDSSVAGLYLKALLRFEYVDLAVQLPELRDGESGFYRSDSSFSAVVSYDDAAKTFLTHSLTICHEQKRWSSWCTRSAELLHERFPFEYAPERSEYRAEVEWGEFRIWGP